MVLHLEQAPTVISKPLSPLMEVSVAKSVLSFFCSIQYMVLAQIHCSKLKDKMNSIHHVVLVFVADKVVATNTLALKGH